ncbi:nitronate monooxygenase [Olivibacter ginsenosidimutans]|uniref:Propionate 3-nitronate monooxygenase n=1 Tax=Olivibacter ginsenosidimutans TaxID=1176537 RepID=A0ABP9B4N0_9SPHI
MNWENDITKALNIAYPIIQAPMFGVSTTEMVVATSQVGALGTLALGDIPAEKCVEAIQITRKLTKNPFAVNIFVHRVPEMTIELKSAYLEAKVFIENLAARHQINVSLTDLEDITLTDYHDQIDAIIAENCKIVSFTFGNLDQQCIDKLKANGTTLIGTATSVEEAKILENSGIHIICVQGFEAGGHRGSFTDQKIPKIGGLALLSQVYDSVKTPLIYAGGIYNARTLLAAKMLGAQGFQIGSLLLGSAESGLQEFEKQKLRNASEHDIVLTKSFSGRYARGLKNIFTEALDNSGHILPYPYQNKLTTALRKVAKITNNAEFVSIWLGQSINKYHGASTTEIIGSLIKAVENTID